MSVALYARASVANNGVNSAIHLETFAGLKISTTWRRATVPVAVLLVLNDDPPRPCCGRTGFESNEASALSRVWWCRA